jgi:hypothetical protein
MSLTEWLEQGWLSPHRSSRMEIGSLLKIVDRDMTDAAAQEISDDWRFGIAYNAALKLCTILLHASGYRVIGVGHHYRTIRALPVILGKKWENDARYLDTCRNKRNIVEYDYVGRVSEGDVEELIQFVHQLRGVVLTWLKEVHPEFLL